MSTLLRRIGLGCVAGLVLGATQPVWAISATGGAVTTSGVYAIHTFTTVGSTSLTFEAGGVVDVLVVGGGGGGGSTIGGGGGAGGFLTNYSYAVTAGTYSVVVGIGGAGASGGLSSLYNTNAGVRGSNSVFGSLTAFGGGGGGSYNGATTNAASAGGSGGGIGAGCASNAMAGVAGQGYAGGVTTSNKNCGAGGGGASAVGSNGFANGPAGAGGAGWACDFSGTLTNYAGGGGGGVRSNSVAFGSGGAGGLGGGGAGSTNAGVAGTANMGGGGGGGGFQGSVSWAGGAGGSGIVIVRYNFAIPDIANQTVSNVTATSADLNITLISTGVAPATVIVYSGPADGGTNAGGWANTNVFAGFPSPGALATNVPVTPGGEVFFRYGACNAYGVSWATNSGYFLSTNITVSTLPAAIGQNNETSRFWFARPDTMTNGAVTVNFAVGGTASNGLDYTLSSTSNILLAAGVSSAAVQAISLPNSVVDGDKTLTLTLTDGAYTIGTGSNATLTITNSPISFTWKGAANGDWFSPTNWSVPGVPGPGDMVTLTNSSVLVSNSPASLASFSITNATLTFTNWTTSLTATTVRIANLGTLTHSWCVGTNDMTNRVWLVTSNLTIETGGKIDVTGKGYLVGPGYGTSRCGGSYGGRGGNNGNGTNYPTYGSPWAPLDPGSAGGTNRGGGVVLIQATGHVQVNGTIKANGQDNPYGYQVEGAGGSVYIASRTFGASNGVITANGDRGDYDNGGGGGGRIAIYYDASAETLVPRPSIRIDAAGGAQGSGAAVAGEMGTLCLTDGQVIPASMTLWDGQLYGPTNWYWGDVTISTSMIRMGGPYDLGSPFTINVAGSLTLQSNTLLTLYGGLTNAAAWTNGYGARVTVSNDLTIKSNSWVCPISYSTTNGASLYFEASNLTVQATAGINANTNGFAAGYGPGRRLAGTTGGGYGGRGQGYSVSNGGDSYGSSNAPMDPGSPGLSGKGGGLIRMVVTQNAINDGTLTANGLDVGNSAGAGSGGGIFIQCWRWAGAASGSTSARGGNCGLTSGAAGGGGRIAIYRAEDAYFGSYNVTNGTVSTNVSPVAQPGTLVLSNLTAAGTYTLTVVGNPAQHDSPSPVYGGSLVTTDSTVNASVTSPADQAGGTQYVCLGWTLTNALGVVGSDVTTQTVFQMTTNLWLTWNWTNSYYLSTVPATNGSLVVDRTGWYTNRVAVTVEASPSDGYTFVQWSGDVPEGYLATNPLTLTMDQPRTIIAHFASTTPGTKRWTGTGDWYVAYTNWGPSGVPGPQDDVVIGGGAVAVHEPTRVKSLTVTNGSVIAQRSAVAMTLTVDQDILVSNATATLTVSNLTLLCGGDLNVKSAGIFSAYGGPTNATVGLTGAYVRVTGNLLVGSSSFARVYSDPITGGSPIFDVSNLTVQATAGLVASNAGYKVGYGPGRHTGASGRVGGGYGGHGQGWSAPGGGLTYGSSNAPVDPGSPGDSGWGGGLIRLTASRTIVNDGAINADARNMSATDVSSGSGGGIFLQCRRWAGAASGAVSAKGGDATGSNCRSGGGGRIAIWRSEDAFFGTFNVTNGAGTSFTPYAEPGTLVLSNLTVTGSWTLNVSGRPAQHGAPSPVYGDGLNEWNSTINASVDSPANQAGGTQYVCLGWTLTNALGVVDSGTTTQTVFQMTTNLWLIWNWTNAYYLSTATTTNGSIVVDQTGWYTDRVQVVVQATNAIGYTFLQWSGDVPSDQLTANPLTVTMDRPRTILAHFVSTTPGSRRWTGTGDWFASYTNWVPAGAPGVEDDVTLGSGTVTVRDTTRVHSLTVSNGTAVVRYGTDRVTLTVDQNVLVSNSVATLTVSNATLVCGQDVLLVSNATFNVYGGPTNPVVGLTGAYVRVSGTLFVGKNCWVKPYSEPTGGGSPIFSVRRMTIEGPTGGFDADAKGFASPYGPGFPTSATSGGAYGGRGAGISGANTKTYGDSNAPVQCGSPGYRGYPMDGRGGGLVRVHADSIVTVNGVISANGQGHSGGYYGCGSGGGIYITCAGLRGAATGVIRAEGGHDDYTDSAGGGGGRIAIYAGGFAYNGAYSVTNGISYSGCNVPATPGTLVLGPWAGATGTAFLFR